jgi:hypothetical protein
MSGEGDDYSDDEVNDLYDELADALEGATGSGGSGGGTAGGGAAGGAEGAPGGAEMVFLTVTAKIEWAGEYANNGHDGMREVHFRDRINITRVREALASARRLEELAARGPLRSYGEKSPLAQFRRLAGTAAGRQALADADVGGNRRTRAAWASGARQPNRANQRAIEEAYQNVRNPGRGVMQARRDVADRLTDALRDEYGSNVRFRDIRSIEIR